MKKILVIGWTGFVGQYLVQKLSQKYQVFVVGRCEHRQPYIDIHTLPNVSVTYGVDTTDISSLERHFQGIDIVINLAWMISFRQKDTQQLLKINHKWTLNVLHCCEKYTIGKFIHVSSTAALGFSEHIIDESCLFPWEQYKKCIYSYSKSLSNSAISQSSCPSVILYPSLILGPGDTSHTQSFIDAIRSKKMPFNMPGSNSYVDVRDFVEAVMLSIDIPDMQERFIVSTQNFTFSELNTIIATCVGVESPKKTLPKWAAYLLSIISLLGERLWINMPVTYENIFMSFQNRRHNADKIRQLGWQPRYNLLSTFRESLLDR
jgi:dihydroflavonol-4-reductase